MASNLTNEVSMLGLVTHRMLEERAKYGADVSTSHLTLHILIVVTSPCPQYARDELDNLLRTFSLEGGFVV